MQCPQSVWVAARSSEKKGLLWSGVITSSQCPVLDDLHNDAGWVWYLVHKTKNKDEAADRPSDVIAPPAISGLIESSMQPGDIRFEHVVGLIVMAGDTASTHGPRQIGIPEQAITVRR